VKISVDGQLPRRLALWLQQRGHAEIHTLDVAKHEFIGLSRNQVIFHR
jgi:predicted nuclease of predicted toxin-antitoxin system